MTFIEDLAEPRPDPGGGAAAAYGASLGLALLRKIAQLEFLRGREESEEVFWRSLLDEIDRQAGELIELREEDVRAYEGFVTARADTAHPEALLHAIERTVRCPIRIIEKTSGALGRIAETGSRCKKHLVSDLQVACELMGAAINGAFHIAVADLALVKDIRRREELREEIRAAHARARAEYARVGSALVERISDR